ncbi:MAG: NINE protein [Bacteroidetes bacterium]|nr:NINE protein [Bacteroidota bacterium]
MKKLLLAAMFCLGISTFSFAAGTFDYYVNDDAVEAAFTQSTLVAVDMTSPMNSLSMPKTVVGEKTAMTAWLWSFLGVVGAHRWYLGTSTTTKVVYCLCGWALLGVIDWWVLLINGVVNKKDISGYVNNTKVLMWKK